VFFCDREAVSAVLKGKTVAIVGSGPGVLENQRGFVDSHAVVVRVNNFKTVSNRTGHRTDIFYSFFGTSIKKRPEELQRGGVQLCICKCPNAQFIESPWHRAHSRMMGVDFRWIYAKRENWWFCPTYVPTVDEFMAHFKLLGGHVPTTGFSAILDVLSYEPKSIFLTGFDFFASRVHNVNERWKPANPSDPIGHVPSTERNWLLQNIGSLPITVDPRLAAIIKRRRP
jgi:hypothetical protein